MTRALSAGILLCLLSMPVLRGQEAAFEVASIRPNRTNAMRGGISRDGPRLTFENVTLRECITFAYSIPTGRDYALSGPGWLDEERVDILATFPAAATRDQIRQMTQRLLRDRFGVVLHKENRAIKAYVLALDRNGHKLKPSQVIDGSFTFRAGSVIFTALREQLGLLLRPEDATVAVLVVDSMNRTPTEN